MRKFFKEFKAFISKGSVLDLAVGIIIGSAFTAIVNALVNKIIMPLITAAVGKNTLEELSWTIREAVYAADGVTIITEACVIGWGAFLQAILNFLIIALVLFIMIKILMRVKGIFTPKFYGYTKDEYVKMRIDGMKKKDIEKLAAERDAKIAEERKLAEEEAKKHTTEALLEDIKKILEDKVSKE